MRGKKFLGVTIVLPQFLKGAIKRMTNGSTDTIINDSFFRENKVSTPIQKNILLDEGWESIKKEDENITIDEKIKKNPLAFTYRICFELSNLCNYADIHRKCPLNLAGEPETLETSIVFDSLDFLAKYNFQGRISFNNYNEPLIDPRLFIFIKYARSVCPNSNIYICTNGFYLTQTLANELVAAGISSIHVSGYFQREMDRLSKIHLDIPYEVQAMRLDDTLKAYQRAETDSKKPCFAPLSEIIITSDAQMTLCCLDWQRRYSFGNLREHTLEEIITKKGVQKVYQRLSRGDRVLDICKRCDWTR